MKLRQLMLPAVILLTSFVPSAAVDADELVTRCQEQTRAYYAARANYDQTADTLLRIRLRLTTPQHGESVETLVSRFDKARHKTLLLGGLAERTALQVIALQRSHEAKNQ